MNIVNLKKSVVLFIVASMCLVAFSQKSYAQEPREINPEDLQGLSTACKGAVMYVGGLGAYGVLTQAMTRSAFAVAGVIGAFGPGVLGQTCDMASYEILDYLTKLDNGSYHSFQDYLDDNCDGKKMQCSDPLLNVDPFYCGGLWDCASSPFNCMSGFTCLNTMVGVQSTSFTVNDWHNASLFLGASINNGSWLIGGPSGGSGGVGTIIE